MPEQTRLLHDNYKPRWGPRSTLSYSLPEHIRTQHDPCKDDGGMLQHLKGDLVSDGREISFVKVGVSKDLITPSLIMQRSKTKIRHQKGIPVAHPQATPFASFAASVDPTSPYEKNIWTLASILFDEQDVSSLNLPSAEPGKYEKLVRKDRLTSFWSNLCRPTGLKSLDKVIEHEDRAILHLSHHDIPRACDELIQAKDFRLSTLIAQLGDGDQVLRDDMASQIDSWRELNVLSEMTEPVRALYSLLAGKTCKCEGKKGPPEDRARDFIISQRFKLDWKQAFGLRLYYVTLANDPVEVAIKAFEEDLKNGLELAKPTRTVIGADGNGQPAPGDDEDILWSLLKLYAASKDWLPIPSITHILNQQDRSADNKLNVLLSFQLYHALTLRFPQMSNPVAADALTVDFVAQLDAIDEWIWAMFAACHITSAPHRQQRLQDLLAQHALEISTSDPQDEKYLALTRDLHIPAAWIWQAKALAARVVTSDHVEEVDCLVRAGDWTEAHNVLRRTVAPKCIISEDWELLEFLLEKFNEGKENIQDWATGGQVFEDFLAVIHDSSEGGGQGKISERDGHGDDEMVDDSSTSRTEALSRLMDVLPMLVSQASDRNNLDHRHNRRTQTTFNPPRATRESRSSREGLEEMVALKEISRVVGTEVLRQPATHDARAQADTTGKATAGDGKSSSSSLSPSTHRKNKSNSGGSIGSEMINTAQESESERKIKGLTGEETRVLQLPLTSDVRKAFGRETAVRYCWDLMAGTGGADTMTAAGRGGGSGRGSTGGK